MKVTEANWTTNEFAGHAIRMRNQDGYFSATDMCKVGNKLYGHYRENSQTKDYVEALSTSIGIPIDQLINKITTGPNEYRGTWVHPKVAIHLAMWISPKFSVKVIDWVDRFLRGDITLVKDIVERHDAINNTQSEVLITTMEKQIAEYKKEINTLGNQVTTLTNEVNTIGKIKEDLQEQVEKLNQFTCKYCNRRYSSTNGLTRHLNNNCTDKMTRDISLTIDMSKFKSYAELLAEYDIEDFDYSLEFKNWDSDEPILVIYNSENRFVYKVGRNESRWRAIKFMNKHMNVPLQMLLDDGAVKFISDNDTKLKTLNAALSVRDDYLLADEFKIKLGIVEEDE